MHLVIPANAGILTPVIPAIAGISSVRRDPGASPG